MQTRTVKMHTMTYDTRMLARRNAHATECMRTIKAWNDAALVESFPHNYSARSYLAAREFLFGLADGLADLDALALWYEDQPRELVR